MTHSATTLALLLGLQSLAVSVPAIWLVRRLCLHWNLVDRPDSRKIHKGVIPNLGGAGIFIGLVVSFLIFRLWVPDRPHASWLHPLEETRLWLLMGCSLAICLVGLWDDIKGMRARVKLVFQALVAVSFVIGELTLIPGNIRPETSLLHYLLQVGVYSFWIVLLMNALNLMDGMDGLAGGIGAIAAFWLTLGSLSMGSHFLTWSGALLLGACCAFLVFNFNPACIFMGDTGSMLIGLWLGAASSGGDAKTFSALVLVFPIVLLMVPILEVVTSIMRRAASGSGIFHADSKHTHHRLLKLGFAQRDIVLFYYAISFLLGAIGYLVIPQMVETETGSALVAPITTTWGVYLLVCIIAATTFLAYFALVAVERRYENAIQMVSNHLEAGDNVEEELRELASEEDS